MKSEQDRIREQNWLKKSLAFMARAFSRFFRKKPAVVESLSQAKEQKMIEDILLQNEIFAEEFGKVIESSFIQAQELAHVTDVK